MSFNLIFSLGGESRQTQFTLKEKRSFLKSNIKVKVKATGYFDGALDYQKQFKKAVPGKAKDTLAYRRQQGSIVTCSYAVPDPKPLASWLRVFMEP